MADIAANVAARETTRLIGSDKVEGTAVRRTNGDKVGTIERVMIDKRGGRVAYAVMSFGGFLGIGDEYRALPWSVLRYNEDLDAYELNLTEDQLRGAPAPRARLGHGGSRPQLGAEYSRLLPGFALLVIAPQDIRGSGVSEGRNDDFSFRPFGSLPVCCTEIAALQPRSVRQRQGVLGLRGTMITAGGIENKIDATALDPFACYL